MKNWDCAKKCAQANKWQVLNCETLPLKYLENPAGFPAKFWEIFNLIISNQFHQGYVKIPKVPPGFFFIDILVKAIMNQIFFYMWTKKWFIFSQTQNHYNIMVYHIHLFYRQIFHSWGQFSTQSLAKHWRLLKTNKKRWLHYNTECQQCHYCHFRQHVEIIGGNVNLNNDFIVLG